MLPKWAKYIPINGWYSPLTGNPLTPAHKEVLELSKKSLRSSSDIFEYAVDTITEKRYGILFARPGFGKTTIIVRSAERFANLGKKVLICGPATSIKMNATRWGFELDKEKAGIIWTSFGRVRKYVKMVDVILIDEISRFRITHKVTHPLLRRAIPFYAAFGFTGTIVENFSDEFFEELAIVAPVFNWKFRFNQWRKLTNFVIKL